jgi:hypothetical protein
LFAGGAGFGRNDFDFAGAPQGVILERFLFDVDHGLSPRFTDRNSARKVDVSAVFFKAANGVMEWGCDRSRLPILDCRLIDGFLTMLLERHASSCFFEGGECLRYRDHGFQVCQAVRGQQGSNGGGRRRWVMSSRKQSAGDEGGVKSRKRPVVVSARLHQFA